MSLIDWSDPEEMFGLLVDYVADEESAANDPARRAFLSRLRMQLENLEERFAGLPLGQAISSLSAIQRSIEPEFEDDAAMEHLGACVEELERVRSDETP